MRLKFRSADIKFDPLGQQNRTFSRAAGQNEK
jgi:hypothetical protein